MKYLVHPLDGRHSYRDWFQYYVGFSAVMGQGHGPMVFNDALRWCTDTYGWSAEIRQYVKIMQWTHSPWHHSASKSIRLASQMLPERSTHCNPNWSWSNAYADLRIYFASSAELAFFQLAHPVDRK